MFDVYRNLLERKYIKYIIDSCYYHHNKKFVLEGNYFSTFINEYPRETADTNKKEMNAPTTTNSSIYLFTSLLIFNFFNYGQMPPTYCRLQDIDLLTQG